MYILFLLYFIYIFFVLLLIVFLISSCPLRLTLPLPFPIHVAILPLFNCLPAPSSFLLPRSSFPSEFSSCRSASSSFFSPLPRLAECLKTFWMKINFHTQVCFLFLDSPLLWLPGLAACSVFCFRLSAFSFRFSVSFYILRRVLCLYILYLVTPARAPPANVEQTNEAKVCSSFRN